MTNSKQTLIRANSEHQEREPYTTENATLSTAQTQDINIKQNDLSNTLMTLRSYSFDNEVITYTDATATAKKENQNSVRSFEIKFTLEELKAFKEKKIITSNATLRDLLNRAYNLTDNPRVKDIFSLFLMAMSDPARVPNNIDFEDINVKNLMYSIEVETLCKIFQISYAQALNDLENAGLYYNSLRVKYELKKGKLKHAVTDYFNILTGYHRRNGVFTFVFSPQFVYIMSQCGNSRPFNLLTDYDARKYPLIPSIKNKLSDYFWNRCKNEGDYVLLGIKSLIPIVMPNPKDEKKFKEKFIRPLKAYLELLSERKFMRFNFCFYKSEPLTEDYAKYLDVNLDGTLITEEQAGASADNTGARLKVTEILEKVCIRYTLLNRPYQTNAKRTATKKARAQKKASTRRTKKTK